MRPRGQAAQHEGERAVELFDFGVRAEAFAVGRVCDDAAVLSFRTQLVERAFLPMNVVGDARLFGMVTGEAQGFGIDVVTDESFFEWGFDRCACFFAKLLQYVAVEIGPRFEGEFAMEARSNVAAH